MVNDIVKSAVSAAGFQLKNEMDDAVHGFEAFGLEVNWEFGSNSEEVVFWAVIGFLEEHPSMEVMEYLLEVNCFGDRTAGGHVGFYRPSRALIYSYRCVVQEDANAVTGMLKLFVEKALQFTAELQENQVATESEAEVKPELPMASLQI